MVGKEPKRPNNEASFGVPRGVGARFFHASRREQLGGGEPDTTGANPRFCPHFLHALKHEIAVAVKRLHTTEPTSSAKRQRG